MTWLATTILVLPLALAIDRLVGDPPGLWRRVPHPVALFGRAIDALDARLNDAAAPPQARRRNGVFAVALLTAGAVVLGLALDAVLALVPFRLVVKAVLVAVLLAQKSLIDHVADVERALTARGLAGGRRAVARIVGRDVSVLDEAGVSRAAIESAAENFSDGVIGPAFWYLVLGLPGLLAYKMINTADSMIGHRSPRYEAFGWAAARFDDLLNLFPARISALLIAAAAWFCGFAAPAAWTAAVADAPKHKSPNAGWPEAALAGALGLALGGPRRYGDVEVNGAWLNGKGRATAGAADIRAALRLVDAAWALLAGLAFVAAIIAIVLSR